MTCNLRHPMSLRHSILANAVSAHWSCRSLLQKSHIKETVFCERELCAWHSQMPCLHNALLQNIVSFVRLFCKRDLQLYCADTALHELRAHSRVGLVMHKVLFCRTLSLLYGSFAKETYGFNVQTQHSRMACTQSRTTSTVQKLMNESCHFWMSHGTLANESWPREQRAMTHMKKETQKARKIPLKSCVAYDDCIGVPFLLSRRLLFIGHFPQKSPIISESFAENVFE